MVALTVRYSNDITYSLCATETGISSDLTDASLVRMHTFTSLHYFLFSAFMHYFDNPAGLIPTWLINWAAKVCTNEIMLQILLLPIIVVLVILLHSTRNWTTNKHKTGTEQSR